MQHSHLTVFTSLLHSFWTNKYHHTRATPHPPSPPSSNRVFKNISSSQNIFFYIHSTEIRSNSFCDRSIAAKRAMFQWTESIPRGPRDNLYQQAAVSLGSMCLFIKRFILCCVGVLYSSDMFSESSVFLYRHNSIVFICLRQDICEKQLKHIHVMG